MRTCAVLLLSLASQIACAAGAPLPKPVKLALDAVAAVGTVVGGQIWQKLAGAPADVPSKPLVMVHFVREIPGGVEYRTRFWMGYAFVDGRPRCMLPPGVRAPAEAPKGALRHNIEEYSNLRVLLPKLYKEYGGRYA